MRRLIVFVTLLVATIASAADVNLPYSENFDALSVGSTGLPTNWLQVTGDGTDTACAHSITNCNDWLVENGSTPSSNTGPSDDHSTPTNTAAGSYLYVEASGNSNATVSMLTPSFNLAGSGVPEMRFWVHRNNNGGDNSHQLAIDVVNGAGTTVIASNSLIINDANLDLNVWAQGRLNLSAYKNSGDIRLRFRWVNTPGTLNWRPDIAIDDFELSDSAAPASVSGRIFEDINYGGGAGRAYAAANTSATASGFAADAVAVDAVTGLVELYNSAGTFVTRVNTDAQGRYSFSGLAAGTYYVRVVNARVPSQRPGGGGAELGVQTFRSNGVTPVTGELGGRNPARADAGAYDAGAPSSLNTSTFIFSGGALAAQQAQSVTPVTFSGTRVNNVDFGFNFDTIVNTNGAGQGSLRQFILNSNTLGNANLAQTGQTAGSEVSIFAIPSAALSGGVAVITPSTILPAITATRTVLDGATQTSNIGDTNPGQLGTGGVVGVDRLTLARVNAPEVELRGSSTLPLGLDLQASNSTVRSLAIYGFGNSTNDDNQANIRIGDTFTDTLIERNIIGTPATSFAANGAVSANAPCGAPRSGADNVRSVGADNGRLRNNLIGYSSSKGFGVERGSQNWLIENNELRCNAIGESNLDGIDLENADTTGATVRGNLVWRTEGVGIDGFGSNGGHTFSNNTIQGNGYGIGNSDGVSAETSGVRLYGANTRVEKNIISGNYGAGIIVTPGVTGAVLSQNSMFNNGTIPTKTGGAASGQLGIDLLTFGDTESSGSSPYLTQNDVGDADTGANGLLNFPVFESAEISGGVLTLTGFAPAGSLLELFLADSGPNPAPSLGLDFGEGQTYLTSLTEGSAADTNAGTGGYSSAAGSETNAQRFTFSLPVPSGVTAGTRLTATATLAAGTSEFSNVIAVTQAAVSVSGSVFRDANADDVFNSGETGLANISLDIFRDDGDNMFERDGSDAPVTSVATNANGAYTAALPDGTYWLAVDLSDADLGVLVPGGPSVRRVVVAGSSLTNLDFAFENAADAFGSCDPFVYLFQTSPTDVYGLNLATGASQLLRADIGPPGRSIHTNGLGYNVQDDFIYGSNSTDNNGTISRLDSNFNITLLGPIPGLPFRNLYVGDVSPDGKLYFYHNTTADLHVIELDPASAAYLTQTVIPTTERLNITDIAFNPIDEQIYTVGNNNKNLYRINPTSGQVTNLGNTGITGGATFGAQYYDGRGFFYMSKNQDGLIYRIDTSTPANIDPTALVFSNGPASGTNDGAHCLYAELPLDYGDAAYDSLLEDDGARHVIDPIGPRLGAQVPDEESDAQPSVGADSDDVNGVDDEDGVSLNGLTLQNAALKAGQTYTLDVATSGNGVLNAWIDWNADGFDASDQIAVNVRPSANLIRLTFSVPDGIDPQVSYARFRFASNTTGPLGPASNGEVEDYRVFLANVIVTGTVFYDDGFGNGTPNDAIQNGQERGLENVLITATDGNLTRTTRTNASGAYVFYTAPFGPNVTVSHTLPRGTGSSIRGSTNPACLATSSNDVSAASQIITDANCSDALEVGEAGYQDDQVYPGYDFGVLRAPDLRSDQTGQVASPGVIEYTHQFTPNTLGAVNLDLSQGLYTYDLFVDENCDGAFASTEGPHVAPYTFGVGPSWPRLDNGALQSCELKLRVIVPDGEANATTDTVVLSTDLTWLNTLIQESLSLQDTTVITTGGRLELLKDVCNITDGCLTYTTNGTGKPGDVLEYRIRYRNAGSAQISEVEISDPVPFFTTLVQNAYDGTFEAQVVCPDGTAVGIDQADPNTVAADVMTTCAITEVLAGQQGELRFRVRIE